MAAVKQDVPLSRLLDKIATPFQRLTPIFGVHEINGAIPNTVRFTRKSKMAVAMRQKLVFYYNYVIINEIQVMPLPHCKLHILTLEKNPQWCYIRAT